MLGISKENSRHGGRSGSEILKSLSGCRILSGSELKKYHRLKLIRNWQNKEKLWENVTMRWNENTGEVEFLGDDPGNELDDELALDSVSIEIFGKLFKELTPDEIRIVIRRMIKAVLLDSMIEMRYFSPDGVAVLREVADEMAEKLHLK